VQALAVPGPKVELAVLPETSLLVWKAGAPVRRTLPLRRADPGQRRAGTGRSCAAARDRAGRAPLQEPGEPDRSREALVVGRVVLGRSRRSYPVAPLKAALAASLPLEPFAGLDGRADGPLGGVASDARPEGGEVDEFVGLSAQFIGDHRRLAGDG